VERIKGYPNRIYRRNPHSNSYVFDAQIYPSQDLFSDQETPFLRRNPGRQLSPRLKESEESKDASL